VCQHISRTRCIRRTQRRPPVRATFPAAGAYGPNKCVSGLAWREGYDGDAVCVSTQRRQETWQENANAGVGATGGLKPTTPLPQQQSDNLTLELTGTGTALTVDVYDPKAEPRKYNLPLPYSHTVPNTAKSGDLIQIVGVGKGDTQLGCRILLGSNVVAE
jgi:hypothetical protein